LIWTFNRQEIKDAKFINKFAKITRRHKTILAISAAWRLEKAMFDVV
jgi:hypothetical protein